MESINISSRKSIWNQTQKIHNFSVTKKKFNLVNFKQPLLNLQIFIKFVKSHWIVSINQRNQLRLSSRITNQRLKKKEKKQGLKHVRRPFENNLKIYLNNKKWLKKVNLSLFQMRKRWINLFATIILTRSLLDSTWGNFPIQEFHLKTNWVKLA